MSLRANVLATYASQIYVTLVGILILPLFLKYMGPEAYGLVGFFATLQACFLLLDAGLTPTMARETARYHGGASSAENYRSLIYALQLLFIGVAIVGGLILFFCSGEIASRWLNVRKLPLVQVRMAVQLMALTASVRWVSGIYRSIISGSEQLVWLGGANGLIATLRYIGPLPILIWVTSSPSLFFAYQLLVATAEVTLLAFKAHHLIPRSSEDRKVPFSLAPLKSVLGFAATIAFTSAVWILVTQADKIVLSKILSLSDYGYFTLAVLAASGVLLISGPIGAVLLPRMSRLHAQDDQHGLINIYRVSTQGVAIVATTATLMLAFFPKEVLWVWTGNQEVASGASQVLRLYAVGNGLLALGGFPYFLQYAKGDVKLHMVGNVLFVICLIPLLIFSSLHYGMTGAGYAWLFSNLVYFLFWVPLVHNRFAPGLHWRWLVRDLAGPVLAGILACSLLFFYVNWPLARGRALLQLIAFGGGVLILCSLGSEFVRSRVSVKLSTFNFTYRT